MNLSEHFSLTEMVASETASRRGIYNDPPTALVDSLRVLCAGLEKIRTLLGNQPIHVLSGYRSPELNAAIGGAFDSQHMRGEAADIICPDYGAPRQVSLAIANSDIAFDQLIFEYQHVHVSFIRPPRRDILTYQGGAYVPGIITT